MTRLGVIRGVAFVVTAAASGVSFHAQGTPPLTPGAIVLLANRTDAAASDTLRRALADPDRDVRRAAARVASVAHAEAPQVARRTS